MEPHARQQAFARFIAETRIEVTALGAARRGAQPVGIVPADHAKEEFLPLHVLRVPCGQKWEVPLHQAGELAAVGKAKILPEMIRPGRPDAQRVSPAAS